MERSSKYKVALELIGWLITAVIVVGALAPIYFSGIAYPFYITNAAFIVVFITFARYIFLLDHTWLQKYTYVKIAIIGLSVLIVVSLVNWLFDFNRFIDEQGLQELTYQLKFRDQNALSKYIKNQVLLFGVGAVIAAIILPIRLFISVWKDFNPNR